MEKKQKKPSQFLAKWEKTVKVLGLIQKTFSFIVKIVTLPYTIYKKFFDSDKN